MPDKVLALLGIAAKAGKAVSGEFAVEKAVKENKAFLVVIANDVSDNTGKHFADICNYRKVPTIYYGTKDTLGRCIGRESRACVALTDEGLASGVISRWKEDEK